MKGYKVNIENVTLRNDNFRKVLYTSTHMQLVLMTLPPHEEIGFEVHRDNDQFFRIEEGNGKCIIDGTEYEINNGDVIIVPAGAKHNLINTDEITDLKLYTLYAPTHHKVSIVRKTKLDAENNKEEFDGITTEGFEKIAMEV
jgi:mannose-6-phosphate isomerase-like protein (cupin superfamily)